MNGHLLSRARQLSVEDQIELAEALWDGIVARKGSSASYRRSKGGV